MPTVVCPKCAQPLGVPAEPTTVVFRCPKCSGVVSEKSPSALPVAPLAVAIPVGKPFINPIPLLIAGSLTFLLLVVAGVVLLVALAPKAERMLSGRTPQQEKEKARTGDMGFAAFVIQRPKDGARIRGQYSLQDPHQNTPECKWYWIRVYSDSHGESVWVYKDGKEGKRLYELLKDGKEHKMTCKLIYHPQDFEGAMGDFDARRGSITIASILNEN